MSQQNNIDQELEEILTNNFTTKRVSPSSMEEILYKPFKVLDHGFVRVIDYMGDDSSIVQAARVSYGKGTKQISQDKGLINYLMRHKHTTPFEMCDIKFHIKLPIFIARQWIRHRTASVNEYSARYSIMGSDFYIPTTNDLAPQSSLNKQGRSESSLSPEEASRILSILQEDASRCYGNYIDMMNQDESGNIIDESKIGVSRELARMNLTLNHYTEWYWKINLHNLLHFLALRADPHAQLEIRLYAEAMLDIIKLWVPFTYDAFIEYKKDSALISKTGLSVIRRMIKGENIQQENSGLPKREWQELVQILGI
ncbi:MAG: FAD-dependent thymidylate synthase [Alphaproteobacteria bacterium]|nr:FAD-dependent thymidylate synthase [Alphaproteobacteria bacterium]